MNTLRLFVSLPPLTPPPQKRGLRWEYGGGDSAGWCGGRDCNREQSRFFVALLVVDNGNTRKNSEAPEIPYSSLLFPFFPFISVSFRCLSSNSIAPAFLLQSTQRVGAFFLARKSIAFSLQKHCSQHLKALLPASKVNAPRV